MPSVATTSETTIQGFPAIRLGSLGGDLDAAFLPGVGMVGASLRHRGDELLALPRGLARYAGGRGTLGIPLLYPWANRLGAESFDVAGAHVALAGSPLVVREEHDLPIHGLLAGSRDWRVTASGGDALAAELDWGAHPELMAAFPFPHRLALEVSIREHSLSVRTTVTAGPDRPVPVAFGFHPYLVLPGVPRRDWRVELPAMRHLELDARDIPDGRSRPAPAVAGPLGSRTYDDGYSGVGDGTTFALAGGGRRITVRLDTGFAFAQVFAPPTLDVVCFEPMTAPTNALVSGDGLTVLEPGAAHVAAFSIAVADA